MSAARDTIMEISTSVSFDYPDAVRWQHLLVVHIRLGTYCFVNITTRAVLPQNSVETLIGFQAEYEKIIIIKSLYSAVNPGYSVRRRCHKT